MQMDKHAPEINTPVCASKKKEQVLLRKASFSESHMLFHATSRHEGLVVHWKVGQGYESLLPVPSGHGWVMLISYDNV